jgi:ribosomal-protein-alanine N-acetyltransferase
VIVRAARASLLARRFEVLDLEHLVAIEASSGPASWNREQFLGFVSRPDTFIWIVASRLEAEVPIAFFVLQDFQPVLYVANVAVASDWRRRGVASFAFEQIERIARARGCERVVLDVQEENLGAQLLYRKVGFRAVEIRHGHYDGQDGYRMRKELTGAAGD